MPASMASAADFGVISLPASVIVPRLVRVAAASADQTVETEDFALAQLEADVVKFGRMRQARDLEQRPADPGLPFREDMVDRTADHHAHQLVLRRARKQALAHHLPVAEDRVAICDAVDLVELVADEEEGLACALQELDEQEQLLDLLGRKGGGRLVHDDDARVDRHGARDSDQMLVGDAEIAQAGAGVDMRRAHRVEHFARLGAHGAPVDQAETVLRRVAEENVFGNRQIVEQYRFLVDRRDAVAERGMRRRQRDRFAIDADLALVRLVDAGQDLDQRGLARPVFADKRGDLAGIEREADVRQRVDAGK
jgi:hypothetical protein